VLAAAAIVAACAAALVAGLAPIKSEPRYQADQCTSWAYAKRPDLTRGTRGLAAGDWEAWARANGYRVDIYPEVGDIAVWNRNIQAGPSGHVAYVEAVDARGVLVSERNLGGCGEFAVRRLTPSRVATALFIHLPGV
jgi:surface antigen